MFNTICGLIFFGVFWDCISLDFPVEEGGFGIRPYGLWLRKMHRAFEAKIHLPYQHCAYY